MNPVPLVAASLNHAFIYWPVAWIALALSLFTSFLPARFHESHSPRARFLGHPFTCFAGIGLTIFAFRWPGLLYPFTLNADESQLLAQAITLANERIFDAIVFYGSVQSGSAGPILTYPLLLPSLFGFDIDYASGRVVGLLLLWSACVILYYTARPIAGATAARAAAWVAALCFALSYKPDFVHYSSEHPSLPLLALCSLLFFSLLDDRKKHLRTRLFLLGAALAAVPFAKLQSTIIALTIAGLAYVVLLRTDGIHRNEKLKRCASLTAGGLSIPVFFFAIFAAAGVFGYFWQVYIANNYDYKEAGQAPYETFAFYLGSPKARQVNYEIFWVGTNIFIVLRLAWWILDRTNRASRPWRPLFHAGVIVAASWIAVIAPGRGFPHYLLLTVIPISLFCGILMSKAPRESAPEPNAPAAGPVPFWKDFLRGRKLAVACLFFPLIVWAARPFYYRIDEGYWTIDHFVHLVGEFRKLAIPTSSEIIKRTRKPGERLTVWGWRADYHVETQAPMGTRSACPEFQIRRVPLRDFYRETALEEFKKNRPTFFIDAVGDFSLNFDDRRLFGHYIFPEFADYIRMNYTMAGNFDYDSLYIRNDRMPEVADELKRQDLNRTLNPPTAPR